MKGVNTMTDRADKLKTLSLNSFYYFTGGQWRYYASGLTLRGNPLSAPSGPAAG